MALSDDQIQALRVQYGLAKAPAALPAASSGVTLPPPTPAAQPTAPTSNMPAPLPAVPQPQQGSSNLLQIIKDAASGKPQTQSSLPAPADSRPAIVKATDAINKPAYDLSSEDRLGPTLGKTVANQSKSLGKLVVGAPLGIASTFAQLPGAMTGYGKDEESAIQSQHAANTGVVKLNALISDLKTKDPNAKDPGSSLTNAEKIQHLETALKASGGIVAPDMPGDEFIKSLPAAAVKSVDAPFVEKAIQTYKSASPAELQANEFGHSGPLARLLESVHTGVQSIAEDPQQITPYFLAGKSAIEKYAPGLDSTISGTAKPVISTASSAIDAVKSLPGAIKDKFTTPVDQAIQEGITKGVKPTVVGKKTLAQQSAFYDSANSVVKHIAANRDQIPIVSADGELTNKPPQSVAEFAQAIDAGKKLVFDQYNDLTKQATGADAKVPTTDIVKRLTNTADERNIKIDPEVRAYAGKQIPKIQELDGASPDVVQERIKFYNEKLKNFYKNPSPNGTAAANVDAQIVGYLRDSLDKTIEAATPENSGPKYQELKNQYGNYKALEGEVNHRATVVARQAPANLVQQLGGMASVIALTQGILSGNFAEAASGAFGKAAQLYYKYINSPDTSIKKMFNTVYDQVPSNSAVKEPAIPVKLPTLPGKNKINNVKVPLSNKDKEKDKEEE